MGDIQELLRYKSTRHLLLASWVLITLAIFASITLFVLKPTDAATTNELSSKCKTSNESISISGTTATGRFTVPAGCPGTHVLVASYTAPNGTDGKPYSAQKLFASNRALFGPGTHSLSVQLPNCYYQVDLARGTVLQNFSSTTYTSSPNHILLAAKHGGTMPCEQPQPPSPTPPQPPAPTKPQPPQKPPMTPPQKPTYTPPAQATPPTQSQQQYQNTTVNNTVNPANADTTATTQSYKQSDSYTPPATTETPAYLPDTGASTGAIIATFFGVSSLSSAVYYAVTTRLFV